MVCDTRARTVSLWLTDGSTRSVAGIGFRTRGLMAVAITGHRQRVDRARARRIGERDGQYQSYLLQPVIPVGVETSQT
jgi:hypothetical protein